MNKPFVPYRLRHRELPEALQLESEGKVTWLRPEDYAKAQAAKADTERRLAAHHRAQRRRFYWERALIVLLLATLLLNAAWQLGWLG